MAIRFWQHGWVPAKGLRTAAFWLLLLAAIAGSMNAAFTTTERIGFEQLDEVANRQLDLYAATLDSDLGRYAYLPSLMETDQDLAAALEAPDHPAAAALASRKLVSFKVRAGALATFLLRPDGSVLASSNGVQRPANVRLGQPNNLFGLALAGEPSQFFAANPDNGSSEYYFTLPQRRDHRFLGVLGVGVSLDPLESTWIDLGLRSDSEKLVVMDEDGVIIMSSVRPWKFKLMPLALAPRHPAPRALQKYPPGAVQPLNWVVERAVAGGARLIRFPGVSGESDAWHVAQDRAIPQLGWRLMILSDPHAVWRSARLAAWGCGVVAALVGLLALHLWQRRRALWQLSAARNALQNANAQLEIKVGQRTGELRLANKQLVNEMRERRLAQDGLVQAGKMAVLGQMSAGVSHEINQPLTALRALSKNTTLLLAAGRTEAVVENLKAIGEVAERMGNITSQLKSFARKSLSLPQAISLGTAVQHTLRLLEHRLLAERVQVEVLVPECPLVLCDMNRLEQVLVNLATNALDAMQGCPVKVLSIHAHPHLDLGRMQVRVADTGPRVHEALLGRLFEPFFTTKPAGEGLGLGLVISSNIVREFGSTLRALPGSPGLVFEFDVALAQEKAHV